MKILVTLLWEYVGKMYYRKWSDNDCVRILSQIVKFGIYYIYRFIRNRKCSKTYIKKPILNRLFEDLNFFERLLKRSEITIFVSLWRLSVCIEEEIYLNPRNFDSWSEHERRAHLWMPRMYELVAGSGMDGQAVPRFTSVEVKVKGLSFRETSRNYILTWK